MVAEMKLTTFREVDLSDPFFDSLKAGYSEFGDWFARKASEPVYVSFRDDGTLQGFLYLKLEDGPVEDVSPPLPAARWLKVGTLKIISHGTKLGERFVKKVFDTAIKQKADGIYVTVFEEHAGLIRLFKRYGFEEHATKTTANGTELVLVRDLRILTGSARRDYPLIHVKGRRKFLLAIYPEYHTKLLPDSILNNESRDVVEDLSHTNTIHKVYITGMNVGHFNPGDILVMYRTMDRSPAYYRSVVTSVCVVEEVRSRKSFKDRREFLNYSQPHSVFTREELISMHDNRKRLSVVRMMYNAAFERRTTRGKLLDEVGVSAPRWDVVPLTDAQFMRIMELGHVDESLIID